MIRGYRAVLLSFVAPALLGFATTFSFAPLYFHWLPVLTLAGLIGLWRITTGKRKSALIGLAFGLGLFCSGVSWVYVSLHDFGGMPAPLAILCNVLLSLILASYIALVGLLQTAFRAPPWVKMSLVIPALWALCEWLRGWLLTGFPWLSVGYSQVADGLLAGYGPVLGVFGISLGVMMVAGALTAIISAALVRKPGYGVGWPIAILLIVAGSGIWLGRVTWTSPLGAPISVSLLQGNITQDIKWKPETIETTLLTYRDLILASKSQLTITPETAFPVFLDQLPEEYIAEVSNHARSLGGDLLVGIPETTGPTTYHNSVISLGQSARQTYRKNHLVPFSEFIPLKWLIGWVYDDLLNMPLADFMPGGADQKPFAVAGQKVAMTNCYEDLFGEEVIRQLPNATLLANVSNDAWFGHSWGPQQHLQISQMRALETGRTILRATNTGVTAIIDEQGRVLRRVKEFTTVSLDGMVQGHQGTTPYVQYGNQVVVYLSLALLAISLFFRHRAALHETS